MKETDVSNWEEFEEALRGLQAKREQRVQLLESESYLVSKACKLRFRGQGNSEWTLKTTLERFLSRTVTVVEYHGWALAALPRIRSFTGSSWNLPTSDEYEELVRARRVKTAEGQEVYSYLAYLRHHGFPSPFLDWTASPYIAAFFAFRSPPSGAEHVSMYVYWAEPSYGKSYLSSKPGITTLGPLVPTHKRHYLQQSEYSFCTVVKDEGLWYAPHDEVVAGDIDRPPLSWEQDLLWKYNIPVGERFKVLATLNLMNVNAHSLFGTEESLLESIATTDLLLERRAP